ncbi:MAG: DNA alkylation repair protein [Alphaproteobacteria bacterium CG_4_10_14_0_2_um_filter_63_37]|nr:MAG: DNA alkylation repair protein [Proteobacteria bacterium CG1_02_64_396]PJA25722.1 MAG: DNA alkylation repair protein [Alphaproteobacteria bacterium CG_4_10_14_0_2_um_filter_63_37]
MAEPLKNQYGPEIPARIAAMIAAVHPSFATELFLVDALDGYDDLSLTQRGWAIARALHRHLPDPYPEAVEILLGSLGPKIESVEGAGMAPFVYLPHVFFVAEYGLGDFETSMRAQYELTQRFTAEFSIRPFLRQHPEATLARLTTWTQDPSHHVRRLVSEGSRPRLPWAPRLTHFQRDPAPVLALLERLKDDPSLYVRRSVANNLNDIGKDHPDLLAATARRWLVEASPERQWLVHHALRSAIKRGEVGALAALGAGQQADVVVERVTIDPAVPHIGGGVTITFDLVSSAVQPQDLLVDLKIHFVKKSGRTTPKVFKIKRLNLAPGGRASLRKTVALTAMSTRQHYPGRHEVEAVVNGRSYPIGAFNLRD